MIQYMQSNFFSGILTFTVRYFFDRLNMETCKQIFCSVHSHIHTYCDRVHMERERERVKKIICNAKWYINQQITQIRVEEKRRIDFSLFLQQTAKFHWSENERHLLWMVPSRNETCKSIGCMVFAMLTTKIYVAMDHSHTCFRFITWA